MFRRGRPDPRPIPEEIPPDAPLNARERVGYRMRFTAGSIVGSPLTLLLLPVYLKHAKAGLRDRHAPIHFACVTFSMMVLPFLILGALSLFAT